jgi:hypothetical protein
MMASVGIPLQKMDSAYFNKKDIMLSVDSEGAQFAPATLQVQARNHQTDFQQVASHFNDIVSFQRVVELIQILNSEGERNVSKTTSQFIVDLIPAKHVSKLIVICNWTKISLII